MLSKVEYISINPKHMFNNTENMRSTLLFLLIRGNVCGGIWNAAYKNGTLASCTIIPLDGSRVRAVQMQVPNKRIQMLVSEHHIPAITPSKQCLDAGSFLSVRRPVGDSDYEELD